MSTLRRARLRRRVEILRYRAAVQVGGWPLREAEAEAVVDRATLARVRELKECWQNRPGMSEIHDDLEVALEGDDDHPATA